jgi:hypothetical protein
MASITKFFDHDAYNEAADEFRGIRKMNISSEDLYRLFPDIERVIELVVGAFEGQDIPNGAIVVGLGAVIGLTLNERMPAKDELERPEIATVLAFLRAGMEFGRDMELGRVQ